MHITAFFTENGSPKTGLSPTLDAWQTDGTQVLTAVAMTEIDGGHYFYNATALDASITYVFTADGGASLMGGERYVYGSTETALKIEDMPNEIWDEPTVDHQIGGSFGGVINQTGAHASDIPLVLSRVLSVYTYVRNIWKRLR